MAEGAWTRGEYSRIAAIVNRLYFDRTNATSKHLAETLRLFSLHKAGCPVCGTWWAGKTPHSRCFDAEIYLHTMLDTWRALPASTRVRQLRLFDEFTLDVDSDAESTKETDPT